MRRLWVQLLLTMILMALIFVGTVFFSFQLNVREQIQALPSSVRMFFRDDGFPLSDSSDFFSMNGSSSGVLGLDVSPSGAAVSGSSTAFSVNLQPDLPNLVARDLSKPRPSRVSDRAALSWPNFSTSRAGPPSGPARHFGPRNFQNNLEQAFLLSGALSVLVGAALALLIVRRVVRPIEAVSRAARRLAAGDLSARAAEGNGPLAAVETQALSQNFNRMAESLEKLEGERKHMIADLAHELRTPLTIMQSRVDALEDGVLPLTLEEVSKLSTQTQLLTRLVEDLRTLSLADAGRLSVRPVRLELLSTLERDLDDFAARFFEKRIRLEYPKSSPVWVQADPQRLSQVVCNLLENALRYTPEGGWARLEVTTKGSEVTLSLSDSGPGIAPENLPRIFDRFYREREERSREGGGSGLGLAIVKTLLELMGGRVEARNVQGAGAQFRVSLPTVKV